MQVVTVSIHARHRSRAILRHYYALNSYRKFQSTPGIEAGRSGKLSR